MKITIVYDSLYGNTEKIANEIARAYSSHQVQIITAKNATPNNLKDSNLLIVGSPTHGGRPSPNMKLFLKQLFPNSLKTINVAAFTTGIPTKNKNLLLKFFMSLLGYADKHIAKALVKNGGKLITLKTFFVLGKEGPLEEGEIEQAKKWATELLHKL